MLHSAAAEAVIASDSDAEGTGLAEEEDSAPALAVFCSLARAPVLGRYGAQAWKSWAASEHLCIASTFFSKRPENRCTFTKATGKQQQIDYILVDSEMRGLVKDAGATSSLDLGSDHRAVYIRMQMPDRNFQKIGRESE